MDIKMLTQSAENLEKLLYQYAAYNKEAAALLNVLSKILSDARAGCISTPMEWSSVPGDYYFDEGGLREFRDLEHAFSIFKIEITGGETPSLRALRARMKIS